MGAGLRARRRHRYPYTRADASSDADALASTAANTYAGSPSNRGYTNASASTVNSDTPASTNAAAELRARDAYACAYAGENKESSRAVEHSDTHACTKVVWRLRHASWGDGGVRAQGRDVACNCP